MASNKIEQIFASNRAEELGHDVWEKFVIPPSFNELGIGETQKPRVVVGGRGCGKTMLLRYLSHKSAFSPKRTSWPSETIRHVGLYWKADTQFASLLEKRGKDNDLWRAAFGHLAALVLSAEILRSLNSISQSGLDVLNPEQLELLNLERLQIYSSDLPCTYPELIRYFEDQLAEFEIWANDVHSVPQPKFLPSDKFIKRLISVVQEQLSQLEDGIFSVYIDEYENLSLYQQRMVNTWLKHSEPPLIFNLAMKRNGFKTRKTEGEESLSDIHDYREVDLENFSSRDAFSVFSAEIFLSRLCLAGVEIPEFNSEILQIPDGLTNRRTSEYKKVVLGAARSRFPSLSREDLARRIFSESNLLERLRSRISKALNAKDESSQSLDRFISKDFPEASIIIPALLSRQKSSASQIESQLQLLKTGKLNNFDGPTNWIHNNFVGCYLQLYDGLVRPCPLYSGFSAFCDMSHGNLRHFLELCHQTFNRSDDVGKVTPEMQAEAARQVATDLLAEVRSFGPHGNNLHAFLLRLGSLFSLSQQSPSQSEPEKTHFSIQEGEIFLDPKEIQFISEAVKWSIIFEQKGTKKKTVSDPEGIEYVINPIYAPYFHISYRKRRKLEMPASDVRILIHGAYDSVRRILSKYQQKWSVDLVDAPLPLFAHLDESIDS